MEPSLLTSVIQMTHSARNRCGQCPCTHRPVAYVQLQLSILCQGAVSHVSSSEHMSLRAGVILDCWGCTDVAALLTL